MVVEEDSADPVYVGRLGLTDRGGQPAADRLALARGRTVLRSHAREPDGSGQPAQVSWSRGPDQRLLGRGLHAGRTRAARGARRGIGVHRQPGHEPDRAACATYSRPSRPTRTPSSAPAPAARWSWTADPGTGKTVVALHRAAYLLYSDPRIGRGGGGVLFVGPHQAYLAYVDDILPSLGEDSVQICTLRDLVAEGAVGRRRERPGGGSAEGVRPTGRGDRDGRRSLRATRRRPT